MVITSNNNNRRTIRCYRCQEIGHFARDCTRSRTNANQNNVTTTTESISDNIEIYDASEINQFEGNALKPLMIVQGKMDGKKVEILIDSGAEMSLCKPGIAKTILNRREMTATGFDGHTSDTREVRDVMANIQIENLHV